MFIVDKTINTKLSFTYIIAVITVKNKSSNHNSCTMQLLSQIPNAFLSRIFPFYIPFLLINLIVENEQCNAARSGWYLHRPSRKIDRSASHDIILCRQKGRRNDYYTRVIADVSCAVAFYLTLGSQAISALNINVKHVIS